MSVACTSSTETASNSPAASPSTTSSPSPESSPSSTPAETPPALPSASPIPSPSPTAPVVNPVSYHVGEVGIQYVAVTATATGGLAPYTWSTSGGPLPPGLVMGSDGVMRGTPSADGSFTFVVIVEDSDKQVAALSRAITIVRPLSVTGSCSRLCSVEAGCIVCGSLGSVDGGATPLRVSLLSGTVPKGMKLVPLALAGAFPAPSNFSLSVLVTDALGATASIGANFDVFPHIAFNLTGVSTSCVGYGCEVRLPWTPGTPNGTPAMAITNVICQNTNLPFGDPNYGPCNGSAGNPLQGVPPEPPPNTLPNGFSAVVSGGEVVIDFGSPGTYGNWFGSFVVALVDQSPCTPSANCTTAVLITVDSNQNYG